MSTDSAAWHLRSFAKLFQVLAYLNGHRKVQHEKDDAFPPFHAANALKALKVCGHLRKHGQRGPAGILRVEAAVCYTPWGACGGTTRWVVLKWSLATWWSPSRPKVW